MAIEKKASNLLGSLFLIALAIFIIANTVRDLTFYFNKTVVAVNSASDVDKLRDNAMAEISLDLDFRRAQGVRYLTEREFLLIPFSGTGYRLMYAVEGPISDGLIAKLHPPLKGRIVTKDFGDAWEVYGQGIKLQKILARDGIQIPTDAMLVYDAPKELPGVWEFVIFALSVFYLVYKVFSLVRGSRSRKTSEQQAQPAAQP